MRCLSSDPGPTRTATSTTETTPDGRLVVLESRWQPFDPANATHREAWKARVREVLAAPGGGIVAVEQILHAYGDTPDGALIDTKDVESALVVLAYEAGATKDQVVRIPATSWRKDLGIQPPRTDPQVAIIVEWAYGAAALADLPGDAREHAVVRARLSQTDSCAYAWGIFGHGCGGRFWTHEEAA